jgi:hypothetical protein
MESYPKRDKFHAMKVTRLLLKSCAAQSIGRDACLLVAYIASTEDACRYQYAVRFWNNQLDAVLDFKSRKQLTSVRDRAVKAGWLHYQREHDRAVGEYWTLIPSYVQRFDDSPVEDSRSAGGTQTADSCSASGSQTGNLCSAGGAHSGSRSGSPSLPVPVPKKRVSCPDPAGRDAASSKSKKRTDSHTSADMQTAKWMADLIRTAIPGSVEVKNLNAWANTIRLIRERDGKSDSDIREMFSWANGDSFWFRNILSPDKLRKQWNQLAAHRHGAASAKSSQRTEPELQTL